MILRGKIRHVVGYYCGPAAAHHSAFIDAILQTVREGLPEKLAHTGPVEDPVTHEEATFGEGFNEAIDEMWKRLQ